MFKRIIKFNIALSSILVGASVSAKPVVTKDWSFEDLGTSCVVSTTRIANGQQYIFQLSLEKSGLSPVEAWIRELPSSATTKAFRLTTEVKPVQQFAFPALRDSSGTVSFWQIPGNTNSLISYIKRQTRLVVQALDASGTAKKIDFSLRGSSDAVDSLAAKCATNKSLSNDFELSFVPAQAIGVDPLKIDETEAANLRAIFFNALQLNAQKAGLQRDIAVLQAQYAKHLQELSSVTGNLDNLTKKELVNLQIRKSELETQIQSLDQRMQDLQYAIAVKESEISIANADYDTSWKAISPHVPEHDRLAEAVAISKRELQKSQGRLGDLERSLTEKRDTVASYENEVLRLRSQLRDVESELSRSQYDVQATDNILRRFNDYREIEERLRSHPVMRYCRHNRINTCDYLVRRIEDDADREVNKIRGYLTADFNWAQNNLTNLNNVMSQLDSKIRSYTDYEIPSLRSQISELVAQRPSLESSVIRYRDDLSSKQAALQSFDQRVGYAQLKADLDTKSAKVVALRNELSGLDRDKNSALKSRNQKAQELAATETRLQEVLTKIAAGQDRSSELNKILTPYFAEKSRLEKEVSVSEAAIQSKKQEFAQVIVAP
ncbi:hypothetical protein [Bdellovibrio sp. HCB2-146]|uniref:hypothetical protein n=1 Tax=Bdellovibrio sp. HCB2-146 TaxID=3394362 RepID=UPI0039BCEB8D